MAYQEEEGEYYGEEEQYEVEAVLGVRKNKETKQTEYKVLWAGFEEGKDPDATSWEPGSWLEDEGYDSLIAAYEAKTAEVKKKKDVGKSYGKDAPAPATHHGGGPSLATLDVFEHKPETRTNSHIVLCSLTTFQASTLRIFGCAVRSE